MQLLLQQEDLFAFSYRARVGTDKTTFVEKLLSLLDERVAALFSSCRERQAEGILPLGLETMEDAAHLAIFLPGREEGFDLHRIAWDGGCSGKGGA